MRVSFVLFIFSFVLFLLLLPSCNEKANSATWSAAGDIDALITVEILFVMPEPGSGNEQLQIANIQFNNLDIIGRLMFEVSGQTEFTDQLEAEHSGFGSIHFENFPVPIGSVSNRSNFESMAFQVDITSNWLTFASESNSCDWVDFQTGLIYNAFSIGSISNRSGCKTVEFSIG